MKKFRVVYQQREVRECWIEAADEAAAVAKVRRLVDRDHLPAGNFESVDEQEPLYLEDESGKVIDYFEGEA